MGALRILTSQTSTWGSLAGERDSREEVEEEAAAVGSQAGAGDSFSITPPPSEKW